MLPLLPMILAPLLATPPQEPADGDRGRSLFTAEWHAGRRAALMEKVPEGVVVLRGYGTPGDYQSFRQDNNFWYFTGLETPNAVLVMAKDGREILLVPGPNPVQEFKVGNLIDPEEAKELTGIEDCRSLGSALPPNFGALETLLNELAREYGTFFTQGTPSHNRMTGWDVKGERTYAMLTDLYDGRLCREEQFMTTLAKKHSVEVKDLGSLIGSVRVVKTAPEIQAMREASRISGLAHANAMRTTLPHEYEWQVAARMTGDLLAGGAAGPAYGAIVNSGANTCITQRRSLDEVISESDLVLVDYGAEYRYYSANVTRTWPAGREFTDRQRELYGIVLGAHEAALAECKPGGGLGLLQQAVNKHFKKQGLKRARYRMSRWIGMAIQDVGAYGTQFQPGTVVVLEPAVYLPEEGLGIRISDVILITEDGYEILSTAPRTIEEIEALRAEAWGQSER